MFVALKSLCRLPLSKVSVRPIHCTSCHLIGQDRQVISKLEASKPSDTKPPTQQTTLNSFLSLPPGSTSSSPPSRSLSTTSSRKMPPKKPSAGEDAKSSDAKKPRKEPTTSQKAKGAKNARGDLGDKASAEELGGQMDGSILDELLDAMKEGQAELKKMDENGDEVGVECVIYWMRMKDLRIKDNRALHLASLAAQKEKMPLVVLHVLSPEDYKSHDRAARRIDFVLRSLKVLQKLHIPLYTMQIEKRKTIPDEVLAFCKKVDARQLFGNIEYEVDELRRDIETVKKGKEQGIFGTFVQDVCIVNPGKVLTQQGKPYSVFTPWFRNWASIVTSNPGHYLGEIPGPEANDTNVRKNSLIAPLLGKEIPSSIPGFELSSDRAVQMSTVWPAGTEAAEKALSIFLEKKVTRGGFKYGVMGEGIAGGDEEAGGTSRGEKAQKKSSKGEVKVEGKDVKIKEYKDTRNRPDLDGTSRLSPYLAAGVISARACLRATLPLNKGKLNVTREHSIGSWTQEISWRDFYQHVLVAWPRVCMRKPFQLKYESMVWEDDDEKLQAWKDGRTGYPIVDAGMRQINELGYMHNRVRMIAAMFLTKDLMMDWKLGEKFFMENLIDGDFASNNGGWQWSAGTGTDPQPYYRIFNPYTQSEKSDETGDYIRHYVPELKNLSGKALHDPHGTLPPAEFKKLGYPAPIVDHAKARVRALARYKNPGSKDDA